MMLTKDTYGRPVAIPETKDMALMIKALECYSRHLDTPATEDEAYHADALCTTFQFWLMSRELEARALQPEVLAARSAFELKTKQEAA